jgi:hypothetical protein
MVSVRSLGAIGSALANATLFAAIHSAWPSFPSLRGGWCCVEPDLIHDIGWEPYLDDPGADPFSREAKPACPKSPRPPSRVVLGYAPLPAGFDSSAMAADPIFACVKVAADGWVLAARLVGGTGSAGMDRRLVNAIRTRWRFVPVAGGAEGAAWHRVRLNAGGAG